MVLDIQRKVTVVAFHINVSENQTRWLVLHKHGLSLENV